MKSLLNTKMKKFSTLRLNLHKFLFETLKATSPSSYSEEISLFHFGIKFNLNRIFFDWYKLIQLSSLFNLHKDSHKYIS